MNSGDQIQAVGEVMSQTMINDLGISGILSLKWKDASIWHTWDGWFHGTIDYPPYQIIGISPDINNNVQVSGNNGNPIPPSAPCP
jgi:hypothetical protein